MHSNYVQSQIKVHGSYEAFQEHMRKIGSKGGKASTPGFGAWDREKHLKASRKGGRVHAKKVRGY